MDIIIVNREKGYLWPFDKVCSNCESNIHLEKKEDLYKKSDSLYYCRCKCGETHRIPAEQIPEEIRNSL